MGFAEANGDLYASCAVQRAAPEKGGVYRRVDGPEPRWEQVYRFPEYDAVGFDDEGRMLRGLTAVPDPAGGGHEVLIGFRYFPVPVIERIDPARGHAVTVELNLREFFGRAWFGAGTYAGPIRCAYNGFVPMPGPASGETVHVAGLQIYHPLFPEVPHNGSFYLARRRDGTYDWGEIGDPALSVPAGRSLDATRTICPSPFPEDPAGRVFYFGGYDGAFVDNRTAWVYRAELPVTRVRKSGPERPAEDGPVRSAPEVDPNFTIEDIQLGDPRVHYLDPEFIDALGQHRILFTTQVRRVGPVYVADLDPRTGTFLSAGGLDLIVDDQDQNPAHAPAREASGAR